ncbi:MAG: DNA-3-methyladenine glycosylase I [Candidatus Hodarchaeales archaeon]|jgi:3-methyladenine DNA glycosylase Tag
MGYVIPPRKKPTSDEGYFEFLTKAVFQAGFSYKVVEQKWPDITEVFENFNFSSIAHWDEEKILDVVQSPKIIRNMKKVRGIVYNAQIFIELVNQYESIEKYLASFRDKSYNERSSKLAKQFKWLGRTGAYVFFWCVDENVPEWVER